MAENETVDVDTSNIEAKLGSMEQTLKQIQAELSEISSTIRRAME